MSLILALFIGLGTATNDDREEFSYREGNYRLTFSKDWKKVPAPYEEVQLALLNRRQLFMMTGLETRSTVEELLQEVTFWHKANADSYQETGRNEIRVAGVRATRLDADAKLSGVKVKFTFVVFTHQGICYRMWGICPKNDRTDDSEFNAIVDSFSFLEERKEWVSKHEGKPARTALLGGLASLEVNRPRWTETFEERPAFQLLDSARFEYIAGGAWIHVEADECHGDAETELEALRYEQITRLKNSKTTDHVYKTANGEIKYLTITGTYENLPYVIRATALQRENVNLKVSLDCYDSLRETVRPDWEQLLSHLTLHSPSKPPEPPAFTSKRWGEDRSVDAALSAFLQHATRLVPGDRIHEVANVSRDGTSLLIRSEGKILVENPRTRKRDAVEFGGLVYGPIAWSDDGKRLAAASEAGVVVSSVGSKKVEKASVKATAAAFTPTDGEVLVCTGNNVAAHPIARFLTTKLERLHVKDGKRTPVIDFPLCRVNHPIVSPDGKYIAVVCNRDYPRTALQGGHLYVCELDDSNLRQLTKEPEDFSSLAWAPDSQSLFVVRRIAVGENGMVGAGGSNDLYRIKLDTAEAVNLTRSGRIGRAWATGDDVLIEVDAWNVAESQRGIFRISVNKLTTATASRPIPSPSNPRANSKAVAEKIQAALAPTKIADVVPTEAILEKIAETFASAAGESCGCVLDFSAASLDRLTDLVTELELGVGGEPAVIFGFGAYYGETLRRVAKAEWMIQPLPFGRWFPGQDVEHSLIDVVLPFSEPFRVAHASETASIRTADSLKNHRQAEKLVLVYPPAFAADAAKTAAGPEYGRAMSLINQGEVKPAIEILVRELERRPQDTALARDVVAICEATGMSELADELSRRAVEAGTEVPSLLLRHADRLANQDRKKALEYYRRAADGEFPSAETLIRLGTAYRESNNQAVAESCWRRAYWRSTNAQRSLIRNLMGLPNAEQPD